jgi:hypothetical protein
MALRLRWLWHSWDEKEKQWKHLLKHEDSIDRALFFNSTYVHIGNGKNTPFWDAKWLLGSAPKDIAPNLYKGARFKNRTVHVELNNIRWIRNLGLIHSPDMLEEYIMLFMALISVTLNDQGDKIIWRWTENG